MAQKGQTTYATAELEPGAYLAICTIRNGGHMRDGMVRAFTAGHAGPGDGGVAPVRDGATPAVTR